VVLGVSAPLAVYQVNMFKLFTVLSYANSAINPFLYAFTNDAFKSAFADAFSCVAFERNPVDNGGSGGGARRRKCANAPDVQAAAAVDRRRCDADHFSAMKLEALTTGRASQSRDVVNDVVAPTTTAVSYDVNSCKTRVVVHLEQHCLQQHDTNEDKCSL